MSREDPHTADRDDQVLGRLLEDLEQGRALETGEGDPSAAAVRREFLEALALLAHGLPPESPPAACRQRLLASVGETMGTSAGHQVVPMAHPVAAAPRAPGRWALPVAASLALMLAAFSGWQFAQLERQRATIGQLSERLADLEARELQMAQVQGQLGELRSRLALVTQQGVEVCTLRPTGVEPVALGSRGVLFASADHSRWYLTLEGLAPCSEGRAYQLWFVPAEGDPISAGTFDVVAGIRVELSSDRMPADTRAVTVTLEPAGGSEAPSGPLVLYGDEVMRIL